MRLGLLAASIGAVFGVLTSPVASQTSRATLSTNRVYRGPIKFPDFTGRDQAFARFKTRIVKEMASGPNFAGHYAIIEMGCGTSCRSVLMADVATGRVYDFPYGGEAYYGLWLTYTVKDNTVRTQWESDDKCIKDDLLWTGSDFRSSNRRIAGGREACDL
ncbi:hypothetical protein [Sphingomonas melonis]|jgi:hypothetical protein|uniref:hypothetical protein n=1 Tax=Sphingomonas melonis TaxID=152682 RepID=UPI0009D9EEA6|nr:hypothetical protein [Sphingomonas melonis]ATI54160.1 hypothetical protein CP552_00105 [Sphingomonas melonis]